MSEVPKTHSEKKPLINKALTAALVGGLTAIALTPEILPYLISKKSSEPLTEGVQQDFIWQTLRSPEPLYYKLMIGSAHNGEVVYTNRELFLQHNPSGLPNSITFDSPSTSVQLSNSLAFVPGAYHLQIHNPNQQKLSACAPLDKRKEADFRLLAAEFDQKVPVDKTLIRRIMNGLTTQCRYYVDLYLGNSLSDWRKFSLKRIEKSSSK